MKTVTTKRTGTRGPAVNLDMTLGELLKLAGEQAPGGQYLSVRECADIAGVDTKTVRRWIGAGELPFADFGTKTRRSIRILADDFATFQARRKAG